MLVTLDIKEIQPQKEKIDFNKEMKENMFSITALSFKLKIKFILRLISTETYNF